MPLTATDPFLSSQSLFGCLFKKSQVLPSDADTEVRTAVQFLGYFVKQGIL